MWTACQPATPHWPGSPSTRGTTETTANRLQQPRAGHQWNPCQPCRPKIERLETSHYGKHRLATQSHWHRVPGCSVHWIGWRGAGQRLGSPLGMQERSPRIWSLSEQARWLEGKSRHNCRHGTHPGIPPASPRHVPNWPPHLVPCSRSAWCPSTASSNHPSRKEGVGAHRKPPWPGYVQGMRLFTKLLVAHPLVGVCLPPDTLPAESLKLAGYMVGSLFLRGHSAGSYAGMVWETILAEFPNIEGRTVLAAIALPPSLLMRSTLSYNRQVHLIHHADDRLCVWTPSHQDMKLLQQQRFIITHITGWASVSWHSSSTIMHIGHG